MTAADFVPFPPSPGVAVMPAGVPLPEPWVEATGTPLLICDLCEWFTDALWPMMTIPPVDMDELNAGDMLICRACSNAIRPPARSLPTIEKMVEA